jgi:hypothetical protein
MYYPSVRLEGLRKPMTNLSQDSVPLGREMNPGPTEYKAGVLMTSGVCYGVKKSLDAVNM